MLSALLLGDYALQRITKLGTSPIVGFQELLSALHIALTKSLRTLVTQHIIALIHSSIQRVEVDIWQLLNNLTTSRGITLLCLATRGKAQHQ